MLRIIIVIGILCSTIVHPILFPIVSYSEETGTILGFFSQTAHQNLSNTQAFFVTERDKGDFNNQHAHMLIGTNTDMSYKEVKYGLGNVSVGDY